MHVSESEVFIVNKNIAQKDHDHKDMTHNTNTPNNLFSYPHTALTHTHLFNIRNNLYTWFIVYSGFN